MVIICNLFGNHIFGISWAYPGLILGISWAYLGNILGISWAYVGHILCIFWAYLGYMVRITFLHDVRVTMITPLVANNFGSVSRIKRHRKVKMNIFTFRWYLVFFNFLIGALGRPGSHFCTTSPTLTRPTVVSPTLTRPDLNLL